MMNVYVAEQMMKMRQKELERSACGKRKHQDGKEGRSLFSLIAGSKAKEAEKSGKKYDKECLAC